MATWRRKHHLDGGCPECGQPFKVGERIDLIREAIVENTHYNSNDVTYRLTPKPPVYIRHTSCVPNAGGEDG
jgi:hypothetical protein